jgi:AraC-like DNA-binding protein
MCIAACGEIAVSVWRCEAHPPDEGEQATIALEIALPQSGLFVVDWGRGEAESLGTSSQILLFNPDEGFRVDHPSGGGDETIVLQVPTDVFRSAAENYGGCAGATPRFELCSLPRSPDVRLLQARLWRCLVSGRAESTLERESLTIAIADSIFRTLWDQPTGRMTPRPPTARAKAAVLDAVFVLHQNFRQRPTLERLASEVEMSPYHFWRSFRAVTGVSPHAYSLQVRLDQALDRVLEGKLDLSRIAYEHGFSSHAHFTDVFHRVYGRPPSGFRFSATGRPS